MKTALFIIIFSLYIISVKMFTTPKDLNSYDSFSMLSTISNDSIDTESDFTASEPTETDEKNEDFNVICESCMCSSRKKEVNCYNSNWLNDEYWVKLDKEFALETIIIRKTNQDYIPILPSTSTRCLIIRDNSINSIEKGAFKNLKLLEKLDLTNNNLTSQILTIHQFHGDYHPYEFDELKSLTEINLGFNRIDSLDSNIFEYIPNLESLTLCYNPIVTLNFETILAIKSINYLQYLDLSNTELSTLPDDLFENSKQLQMLNLSRNHLTYVPGALGSAINLKQLNLDANPIAVFEENSFPTLNELDTLSISNMDSLSAIREYSLVTLPNLKTLYCSNNPKLTFITFHAFYKTHYLKWVIKELYLHNNRLSLIDVHLDNDIDILDIRFNPWQCTCQTQKYFIRIMSIVSKMPTILQRNIICDEPWNLRGIDIAEIRSEKIDLCQFENTTTERPTTIEIPAGVKLIGLGIIVIILVMLLFSLSIKCGWLKLRNRVDDTNPEYQRIEQ